MIFTILNAFAFVLYLAAAVCNGAVELLRSPDAPTLTPEDRSGGRAARLGRPLLLLGLLAQFAAIGAWCLTTHRSPFAGEYGTLAVLAWIIVLTYLVIDLRGRLPAVGAITLLFACAALFLGSLHARNGVANAAFLNSKMISLHVLAILASFALFAFAFGCATLYLLQNRLLKARDVHKSLRRLPSLSTLDTVAYHSVAYALPLLTLGLVLGIIYIYSGYSGTETPPPSHWYLDSHTVVSFAAWILYVLYLGARLGLRWRGVRLQYILIAGLILVLAVYALPTTTHHFAN